MVVCIAIARDREGVAVNDALRELWWKIRGLSGGRLDDRTQRTPYSG